MKLISLNIWGGHVYQSLLSFFDKYHDIDIFCLQEVYHRAKEKVSSDNRQVFLNIFSDIQHILINHTGYFMPMVNGVYGLAVFIRNDIQVVQESNAKIYHNPQYLGVGPAHSRWLQHLDCQMGRDFFSVVNVHGLWNGRGKGDSPERLIQSARIRQVLDNLARPNILCGDFNLLPDTQSIKFLEEHMRNLLVEYGIVNTRTSYYQKTERFADYVFTSTNTTVHDFSVLNDEVSDHFPLLLDFVFDM